MSDKILLAQSLKGFYLYDVDIIHDEYMADDFVRFDGKINLYSIEIDDEGETKKSKKKKGPACHIYAEVGKTKEIERYLKRHKIVGCLLVNSLSKTSQMYQLFKMSEEDCPNKDKIYLGLESYKGKMAISSSMKNMTESYYLERIKENPLYIIDRF